MATAKTHSIQYTLRGVPKDVDEALRRRAKEEGISLNKAAIQAIQETLRKSEEKVLHHDLDHLAGKWVEDPAVEEALGHMRVIDPELWK